VQLWCCGRPNVMEVAGIALSAVALLASLSTAIDGFLFIDEILAAQDNSHYLSLRYGFQKRRLECWKEEVQKQSIAGNQLLEVLPPQVAQLIRGALDEIHIVHQEIGRIVAKHHVADVDTLSEAPKVQLNRVSTLEEISYWSGRVKSKVSWVIRNKERFSERVDKLESMVDNLYEIVGLDALRTASLALSAYTVARTSQSATLQFLQTQSHKSGSHKEPFIVNCAGLKLLARSPTPTQVPIIELRCIDLDFPTQARSMGFYKYNDSTALRVLIEWKSIAKTLSIDDRKKIYQRINLLAGLLQLPKEPEFRVPKCIGLCPHPDSPLKYGFVFSTPAVAPSAAVLTALTLREVLEKAKKNGIKALLGSRFKLAHALASSFALLHSADWLHKAFNTSNVVFFSNFDAVRDPIPVDNMDIVGFEYARPSTPSEPSIEYVQADKDPDIVLYQHPEVSSGFRKAFDLYSLGVVLFEIALWRPLKTQFGSNQAFLSLGAADRRDRLIRATDALGGEVGAAYRDVVKLCLTGDFGEEVDADDSLLPKAFLLRVVHVLERCQA
jgi:hypothetical protein